MLSDYRVKYEREQGVPGSAQRVARQGTDLAIKAYDLKLPDCEEWKVTVDLILKSDPHVIATTRPDPPDFTITVFASGLYWFGATGSQKLITMLHEWYHVLQFSLFECRSCSNVRPPTWMLEGAAVYESYRQADDLRISSYASRRSNELFFARRTHLQLRSLSSKVKTADEYSVSFLAIEDLVRIAGGSAHSLIDFWSELGRTGKLADSFQHAFGISLPSFYRRFQAYANRGYPGA